MTNFTSTESGMFVGRETELAVLSLLLEAAAEGRGTIALIAGEAGIGKTRVLHQFATAAAESGALVLSARCLEGEGAPALWPWTQLVRQYLLDQDFHAVAANLGWRAARLAVLLPELNELLPDLLPPQALASSQERLRLFDAVAFLFIAAAQRRPVVIAIDDLHWADRASLLLLEFLAQELAGTGLLVAGAFRDAGLRRGDALYSTLGELTRRAPVTRITLGGLDVADVARYMTGIAGTPVSAELAAKVTAETEGNPLFIAGIVRLLISTRREWSEASTALPLPSTVREVIHRQCDRLSEQCMATLSMAAVMGREFQLAAVVRACGLEPDAGLDALEEAEAAAIIEQATSATGFYRFSHALIRETLYEGLPSIRRARMHLHIAEAIEALDTSGGVVRSTELAMHYRLAAPVMSAHTSAGYALRAGAAAAAVFAWEDAIGHWQMALDFVPQNDWQARCDLFLAIGQAQNNIGERDLAKESFIQAAAAARRLVSADGEQAKTGRRLLAEAALGYSGPGVVLGKLDRRHLELLEEASALLEDGGQDETEDHNATATRARLLARRALTLFWTPRREASLALSRRAETMARACGDPRALIAALHGRRYVLWAPEHLEERRDFASEMIALAEPLHDAELLLQGLRWQVTDSLEIGDAVTADAAIERYAALAEEIGHPYYCWYARLFRATRALAQGQFELGERLAREAYSFGRRAGDPDAAMFLTMQMLPARTLQGRVQEFEQPVRTLAERYPTMLAYRCRLLALLLDLGSHEEGKELYEALVRDSDDSVVGEFGGVARDGNWLITMVSFARACLTLGDRGRAARLYALLRPYAPLCLVTGAGIADQGPVGYWVGRLAALSGRRAEAAAYLEEALATARRTGAAPMVALTEHALAELLLSARSATADGQARAAALLESALGTAQALDMAPFVESVQKLLKGRTPQQGEKVAPPASGVALPDGLTAREAEVLGLLAAGKSNREIAEALVLSVMTVQNHVRSIYRKADLRNRTEAAMYALHHGLNPSSPQ